MKGSFEYALVFYHRGHALRPELDEFTLGISKVGVGVGVRVWALMVWC